MAEQVGVATVLAPEPTQALAKRDDFGTLVVKDVTPQGKENVYSVAIEKSAKWSDWSLLHRSLVLKHSQQWNGVPVPVIMHAVAYAESLGLDIVAGDVYYIDGRVATTNDARIKYALSSGKIEGYNVMLDPDPYDDVAVAKAPQIALEWRTQKETGTWKGPNYKATVTVKVKGWTDALVYKTDLKQWFTGRNPNWRTRTPFMLRKSSLAHALTEVVPVGLDVDEAPPATE